MITRKDKFEHIDPCTLKRYLEGSGGKDGLPLIVNWFSYFWTNEEVRKISHALWDEIPEDIVVCYDEERIHDRIHHILRIEEAASHDLEKDLTRRRIYKLYYQLK
jgi:hypothetical protein